jgi:hypothetical protein
MKMFTKEEDAFIIAHAKDYGCIQMTKELNKVFSYQRSHQSVGAHCTNVIKIKLTNNKRNMYDKEQIEYVQKHIDAKISESKIAKMFNQKYGTQVSTRCIQRLCSRYNLCPERKGLTMVAGERNPFTVRRPLGTERTSGGKIYIKIADNVQLSTEHGFKEGGNYQEKKRYCYEQYHGKVPLGYQIIHLDGNNRNFEKDNLYAISPSINMIMAANKWYSDNPEVTMTAIKWCELYYAIAERRKGASKC